VTDRYVYSPIIDRPRLVWPNEARLAVWVVPNVEHYQYLIDEGQSWDPYPRTPHPDMQFYTDIDYGNRIGFWRMLEVFDKYNLPITCSLNLAVYEMFPEIMEAAEARDWEVMCHGIFNSRPHTGLSEEREREVIRNSIERQKRLTGRDMKGYFAPGSTRYTPDLLAEAGIGYYVDWGLDDEPTPIRVKTGSMLAMPYSFDVNDGMNFRVNIEMEAFAQSTIDLFDRLYADSHSSGRVMCVPTHPFFVGQPHRQKYLVRIFQHICGHSDIWLATGSQIAEWYTVNHLPLVEPSLRARGFYEEFAL
jgi:allantoinase